MLSVKCVQTVWLFKIVTKQAVVSRMDEQTTTVLRLRTIDYVKPYSLPARVEIVKRIGAVFPDDPSISVLESYVDNVMIYTIVLLDMVAKE